MFWVLVIVAGLVAVVMALFMHETYAPVILQRKVARLRKETGNQQLRSKLDTGLAPGDFFKWGIVRPMKMLARSPIIALFSLYIAIVYGYLYLLFTSISQVFGEIYGFSTQAAGLVYLGLGVGSMAGLLYFSVMSDRNLDKKAKQDGQGMKPEYRLQPLSLGAVLLPAGLFIYGWTAEYRVHWIVPIIGMTVIGVGNILCFIAIQLSVQSFASYPYCTHSSWEKISNADRHPAHTQGTSSMPLPSTRLPPWPPTRWYAPSLAPCSPSAGCKCTPRSVWDGATASSRLSLSRCSR